MLARQSVRANSFLVCLHSATGQRSSDDAELRKGQRCRRSHWNEWACGQLWEILQAQLRDLPLGLASRLGVIFSQRLRSAAVPPRKSHPKILDRLIARARFV